MSRIALVCGNGLSLSRQAHSNIPLHPSKPFLFDVRHPRRPHLSLLSGLARLDAWLKSDEIRSKSTDFERITSLTEQFKGSARLQHLADHLGDVAWDMRHFLCLGYSTYQLALDASPCRHWSWDSWIKQHASALTCALSWNYDLVLERALRRAGVRFHHAGAAGWHEWHGRNLTRIGIPVCKPHGSCNFVGDGFEVTNRMTPDGPAMERDYPPGTYFAVVDVPLTTLSDGDLLSVRDVADIVLPGEFNAFGLHLSWMQRAASAFRRHVAEADTLVVIGFSMAECDAQEFSTILSWVTRIPRVVIADPDPSDRLLATLTPLAGHIELWKEGPRAL